jgi:hypothetical protein
MLEWELLLSLFALFAHIIHDNFTLKVRLRRPNFPSNNPWRLQKEQQHNNLLLLSTYYTALCHHSTLQQIHNNTQQSNTWQYKVPQ